MIVGAWTAPAGIDGGGSFCWEGEFGWLLNCAGGKLRGSPVISNAGWLVVVVEKLEIEWEIRRFAKRCCDDIC